jgi:hypothetical protein
MAPQICPNCGATVPPNAKACPECGSDDETGWSEQAYAPNPDLPDEEFDYDEYTRREFGGKDPVPHGIPVFWWVVGILLLIAILYVWLR